MQWLGRVPKHWDILRSRYMVREVDQRSMTGTETHLSMSQRLGLVPSEEMEERRLVSESYIGAKLCEAGDLVLNRLKAHLGVFACASQAGLVSSDYTVFRRVSPKVSPGFLEPLLKSPACRGELRTRAKGLVEGFWRLYTDDFYAIKLPLPPIREQSAIVRFLDHVDGRIRRYIRTKQKLIKLLEEQTQAIIHGAVTRGLDANVRLKSSGVEWLGDVPEHWEVLRISRFARVGNGSTPSRSNASYWNDARYPWLNSSHVNRGMIDSSDQFVTTTALRECYLPRVPVGSVLVAITGQGKTRGTAAVLRMEATINQHIAFITPKARNVVPEFLQLALIGAYQTLRALSDDSGSTKGALTCEDLKRFRLAIPPQEEQMALVTEISARIRSAAVAIADAEREITLLREYRTRLIADVVTGKLDVREAAANLHDEPEESELPLANIEVDEEPDGDLLDGDAEVEE